MNVSMLHMCGGGHAWQGACVAGGMCGRGACMAGPCMAGDMRGGEGGMHGRRYGRYSGQITLTIQTVLRLNLSFFNQY